MIAFIDDHRDAYGVEPICRVLPIAPSTYHERVPQREDPTRLSARAQQDVALKPETARVFLVRTTDLVQKLQAAHCDLSLPPLLTRLDRFDCLILDDLGYAKKDQAETAVLFALIADRYERRSLIVTCNQPFSE